MEKFKVSAWHSNSEYFTAYFSARRAGDRITVPVANSPIPILGITHHKIPTTLEVADTDDTSAALQQAFYFFNWMTHEDGYAGKEVNDFCDKHNVHASMSVGDIVQIEGIGFWECLSNGWREIYPLAIQQAKP